MLPANLHLGIHKSRKCLQYHNYFHIHLGTEQHHNHIHIHLCTKQNQKKIWTLESKTLAIDGLRCCTGASISVAMLDTSGGVGRKGANKNA